MPITHLKLQNIRCFADTKIELHPQMTVLIGENGSGKSTIAEALASITYGRDEGLRHFPLRRISAAENNIAAGQVAVYDSDQQLACWKHSTDADDIRERLPEEFWLFAYGRYRRVHFDEEFDDEFAKDRERVETGANASFRRLQQFQDEATSRRTLTLSRPDAELLKNLSLNLIAIYEAASYDPRMETLWQKLNESLKDLKQGISELQMVDSPRGYIPMVEFHGLLLPVNELSDGYQAILVIVLDLMMRLPLLFPSSEEPWNEPMVVVIDEIDLHLHVRWQRTVLRQLTTLFPATQFVVTTHSPAVVQGAIDGDFPVVLMKRIKGEIKPKKLSNTMSRKLRGADIGSLMVESKLFDVDSRYSVKYEREQKELERLQKKVDKGKATENDRKRIFEISELFENLMADEEERRADGAFISQMSKLNRALMEDFAKEIKKVSGK